MKKKSNLFGILGLVFGILSIILFVLYRLYLYFSMKSGYQLNMNILHKFWLDIIPIGIIPTFVSGLLGLIFSVNQIRKERNKIAITGMVISIIGLINSLFSVLFGVLAFIAIASMF